MRALVCVWVAALIASLACAKDEDDDGAAEDGTTSASVSASATDTGAAVTDDTGPVSASASASASTTGADDGPASTGSEAGPSSSADDASDEPGTDSGIGTCMPEGADDECRECVKANCCDDWTACANDEVCACTLECHLAGASLGSCKSQCGGESEIYKGVYFCGQMFCLGLCDWDCC